MIINSVWNCGAENIGSARTQRGASQPMRKILALAFVAAILLSALNLETGSITSADPYIPPEQAPQGYRIYSSGTYDAPNIRQDGNTYTLIGNINGTIVIEADSVVLDGAGYTLQGKGNSFGVWLQDKIGVTITNLNIDNFSQGVRFSHYAPDWRSKEVNSNYTTNCTIKKCTITCCNYGLSFYMNLNCNAIGNHIANNTYGVYLHGSANTFRTNRMVDNKYNFWDTDEEINDVDYSNTVDGKTICYWFNVRNRTVPAETGVVILKNCSGIRVQNLNLESNGVGISLYNTHNSEIFGNNITSNYWRGIAVWWSYNNSIIGNQITNTSLYGIEEYSSGNLNISHNLIKDNRVGIYHRTMTDYEVISNNQIIENQDAAIMGAASHCIATDNYIFENSGTGLAVDSNSFVARNNITSNSDSGIFLRGVNSTIRDNYVSENNIGIQIFGGSDNTIELNTVTNNSDVGIGLHDFASNNHIYDNNFIDNNLGGIQAKVGGSWIFPWDGGYIENLTNRQPQHVAGPRNAWDNGTMGNFWSDYNPNDNGAAYKMDDNNQDYHPLSTPIEVPAIEMPTIQVPQELLQEATQNQEPSILNVVVLAIAASSIAVTAVIVLYRRLKKK
jgi:parallel beta-helix repeat protein